jgi:hypothetical protein
MVRGEVPTDTGTPPAIVPDCYQWAAVAHRRHRKAVSSAAGMNAPETVKAVLSLPSAIRRRACVRQLRLLPLPPCGRRRRR